MIPRILPLAVFVIVLVLGIVVATFIATATGQVQQAESSVD